MGTEAGAKGFRCAGLDARVMAFLFDSIVLLAFLALFGMIAMFQILARSNFGDTDPSDATYNMAVGIIAAVVPFWLLFNVYLQSRRGQSVGKYIVGIRVARSDGKRLNVFNAFWRMIFLDPLLFHPLLAAPWLLLAVVGTMRTANGVVLIATVTVVVLSIVAAPVALAAMLADGQRRALHDRISGTLVVGGS